MATIPANSFKAIITGEVDLKTAKADFQTFKSDIEKPIKLTFDMSGLTASWNSIQKQFQNAGGQIGKSFSQSIEKNVKGISVPKGVFDKAFDGVTKTFGNIDNGSLVNFLGTDTKLAGQLFAELQKINDEGGQLQKLKIFNDGSGFEATIKNANTLVQVLGKLGNVTDDAGEVIGKKWEILRNTSIVDYTNSMKQAQQEATKLAESVSKIGDASKNGDFTANIAEMTKQLASVSDTVSQNLVQKATDAANEYKRITADITASINGTAQNPLQGQDLVDAYKKSEDALKRYHNAMKEVRADTTKMFAEGANIRAANDVESWAKKNSKALSQYGLQLKQLAEQMRNASSAGELTKLQNNFKNLKSEINSVGLGGLSFGDQIKKAFVHIGEFTGIYAITSKLREIPSQMIAEVIKIDDALTELRKVSTASASEITDYFEQATDAASKYGQTVDGIIDATASWVRLSYSLEDASNLAEVTAELAQVGSGLDVSSATEGLQATMRGFGLAADEAKRVADIINATGDEQPITSLGVIEGLERSSSAMKEANNSLEETIGLITASTSVTQDATAAGTAWRTKFRNCANVQKCA